MEHSYCSVPLDRKLIPWFLQKEKGCTLLGMGFASDNIEKVVETTSKVVGSVEEEFILGGHLG